MRLTDWEMKQLISSYTSKILEEATRFANDTSVETLEAIKHYAERSLELHQELHGGISKESSNTATIKHFFRDTPKHLQKALLEIRRKANSRKSISWRLQRIILEHFLDHPTKVLDLAEITRAIHEAGQDPSRHNVYYAAEQLFLAGVLEKSSYTNQLNHQTNTYKLNLKENNNA